MYKKIYGLVCLLLLFSSITLHAIGADKGTIIIVNSINATELWTKLFSNIVKNKLEKEGFDVKYVELNVPAITEVEQCEEKCEYLLSFASQKPKLVVYIGDPAWLVTRQLYDNQWSNVPSFICHARDKVPGSLTDLISKNISEETLVLADDIRKNYCVTVADRPVLLKETISLMMELLPKMNKLVFLSDDRYISLMVKSDVEKVLKNDFPDLKFESLSAHNMSVEKLLDTLTSYDHTAGVLYYSWFRLRSDSSTNFIEDNIHKVIYGFSKVPIFNLSDLSHNDDYFAGGCYISMDEFVDKVILAINNILAKPFKTGVSKVTNIGESNKFLNYRHLLYHGVDPVLYPKDAVYYQAPLSFYEKYQVYIIAGLLVAMFVIILIVIMIRSSIHKVKQRNLKMKLLNEYRKLVDNMPMVYMSKQLIDGDDYLFKDVNTAFEVLFDCKREFIIGQRLNQLVVNNHQLSVLAYNSDFKNILVNDKSGKLRYYDRIILNDDEVNSVEEFWVDSTEEYKISQEKDNNRKKMNELNEKYELVLKAANFAIWEYDLVMDRLYCNMTYFLSNDITIGQNEFRVSTRKFLTFVHSEDKKIVSDSINELVSGIKNVARYEYRIINYFGVEKEAWIECNAIVSNRDSSGKPLSIIGAAIDITARKKMEADLLNAKLRAEESNILKSAFLANMSHEIRTPLNAIVGFSNVLAKTNEASERLEFLSIIESNNELLLRLIGDILDLSKIDAGLLEFEYDQVDIGGMFCDLEQEMNYNIKNGISVFFDNHEDECILYTERNRLLQVVKNLLTNAIKFTSVGEIHFGYRPSQNNEVYFYVSDSGCGIAKEQLGNVFERFVKLNSFVQGTGLGLSICKTIIDCLGGEIGVDSEIGKGSTFWFTLPAKVDTTIEETVVEEMKLLEQENNEVCVEVKKRILIAEDVESNFQLFESILRNKYDLMHAWDGEQAVKLFEEFKPDLILMDIKMPNMNGYCATAEIRKVSDVIILAVTAFAFVEDEQSIMNSGFNAYITKPIDSKQLKEIIKKCIG